MNEKIYRTVYIRRDSKRPIYAPFPVFLMDYNLSMTARVLYTLMFNRAMLSQINNWVDDLGRVFIVFTEAEMCETLHRGISTVKKALTDLERFDLPTMAARITAMKGRTVYEFQGFDFCSGSRAGR